MDLSVHVDLSSGCKPPYCTGSFAETIHQLSDWVRMESLGTLAYTAVHRCTRPLVARCLRQDGTRERRWMWVPYACYYHLYNKESLFQCAAASNVSWIVDMGDSQVAPCVGLGWALMLSRCSYAYILPY